MQANSAMPIVHSSRLAWRAMPKEHNASTMTPDWSSVSLTIQIAHMRAIWAQVFAK